MRHAPTPRDLQTLVLGRRFGLPRHRARLLAEMAYGEGRL